MISIYIDVLFAVNLIINILIIEGCGAIMCIRTKWYRTLPAAALGAIYAVGVFFPNLKIIQTAIMKVFISAIMVWCAFKFKGARQFFKLLGAFYVVSFIFGGSLVAILSMRNLGARMGAVYSNGTVYFNLPWKMLFMSGAGTYFLITVFAKIRKKRIDKEAIGRDLSIFALGQRIDTRAIIDTGNSLADPITGDPVIVCEYGQIQSLLPGKSSGSLFETLCEAGFKARLIPFTSIGEKGGVMPAFLPDKVKIDNCEAKRCLIGISEVKLSKNEDYHALLNPAIVIK